MLKTCHVMGIVYDGGSFVITNMKIRVNKGLKTRSDRTKREVTVGIAMYTCQDERGGRENRWKVRVRCLS